MRTGWTLALKESWDQRGVLFQGLKNLCNDSIADQRMKGQEGCEGGHPDGEDR